MPVLYFRLFAESRYRQSFQQIDEQMMRNFTGMHSYKTLTEQGLQRMSFIKKSVVNILLLCKSI